MINSGREWDWMDSQINKLNQMKTRFKQSKIDYIVKQDYTREELAQQIIEARYKSEKYRAGEQWLDELATHYRDNQGDDDYSERCSELYEEYQMDLKNIKRRYLNDGENGE